MDAKISKYIQPLYGHNVLILKIEIELSDSDKFIDLKHLQNFNI